MVVEVILAEIGEAGRFDVQAIKPALFEPMGRGLKGQVGDAL